MKQFDWHRIIEIGNGLEDLNEGQWRFIKGLIAEIAIESNSGTDGPTYVGQAHKDYDWPKYGISIELKSTLSASMYTKKGLLRKKYTVKLNNSNGTNKQKSLQVDHVADYLIVLANDGAFVIDQTTILDHAKALGDGFSVTVPNSEIIELSGKIVCKDARPLGLKAIINQTIRTAIK